MTDKEFKKLGRTDLISIIYKLQLDNNRLTESNEQLKAELEEAKRQIPTGDDIQLLNSIRKDNRRLHMLEAQVALMEKLEKENDELRDELKNRPQVIDAGSIADAVVEITGIFKIAQDTADKYVEEVKKANEGAELRAKGIIASAERKANEIIDEAKLEAEKLRIAAQAETAVKWEQFNANVSNVLKAHSELSELLGLGK